MKGWLLLLATALTSGCGTLGQPPLPKFAVGEAPLPTPPADAWALKLRATDVVYFGLTKRPATDDQPAWRVVETLQVDGAHVALGWTDLPSTLQPLFEQWQRREISAAELLGQLPARERSDGLRRALRPDLRPLALGAPRELLAKIRAGEALSGDERALVPNDFRTKPDALDNFAERVSTSSRLRRYDMARLYRLHLAAEQMVAQNIVRFMQENPGTKLLVFLPDDAMIDPREVADFVAQKSSLRQLILDHSGRPPDTHSRLLTNRTRRTFEIVNRSPETSRDHRCLSAPRLRT